MINPIVVDLDGTLIQTDMLHETSLRVLRDSPWNLLRVPLWLSNGRACLKQHLAKLSQFDPAALPYNQELITWLKIQSENGRPLVLCTASDHYIAQLIADHLGIFDIVIASDGIVNLAGTRKADELVKRFGEKGFDYAGNSNTDLAVWKKSRRAIVVNSHDSLAQEAAKLAEIECIFPAQRTGFSALRRMLRVHQWLKNLLLFIPLFAAHQVNNTATLTALLVAFLAFSLCASSVYVANDLLDLESDRQHPRKRLRPFASGQVPIWIGVLLAPALLVASMLLASFVGGSFLSWLSFYFLLTCAYSWGLKRLMLVDCLTLAVLYTLRIVAGAAAANMSLSFWLIAFAVFLFLSLSFVKRYAELEVQLANGKEKVHGRGYFTSDAPMIQAFGTSAGYASVLVLALYLNSDAVVKLYKTPELIWAAVPVMLFWMSWMWMQAHRGLMHDDPLVFAVKDKASLFAGALFAVIMVLGAVGLPW
jgi:4-hydroxybenzoate polyprenyltransferase/phosphoserine phosphatase